MTTNKYVTPSYIIKAKKEAKGLSIKIRSLKAKLSLYERNKLMITVKEARIELSNLVKMANYIHVVLRQHNQMKKLYGELKSNRDHLNSIYGME